MKFGSIVVGALVLWALALGLGGCSTPGGFGAAYPPEPAREYRGMWVATVANIDWPSKPGLGVEQMREEMAKILDVAASLNLNAVFLQVRPACDAIYSSQLEPWSECLTGAQGVSPGFDPLVEWIAGAHQRGIELHAWFNPFRARSGGARSAPASTHVCAVHPDWVRPMGNEQWLDPGVLEAREHSLRVILDVVRRYDIDGVHFDDYFYPYPKKEEPFPDEASYARYTSAGGTLSLSDWRRDNINRFVSDVYSEVHRIKPQVRVGISPFGIWRPGHPRDVKGFDAYEGLCADSLRWLDAGWVDYLAPQLYWKIDSAQPYAELLDWWLACSLHSKRRPILAGNFTSRIVEGKGDSKSWEPVEILNQITRTRDRASSGAAGNIHFSAAAILQNRRGVADALRSGPYAEPSLPPEMPWLASGARPAAPRVDVPAESDESVVVRWTMSEPLPGERAPRRSVVWSRYGGVWSMHVVGESEDAARSEHHLTLARQSACGELERVGVEGVDAFGRVGSLSMIRIAPVAPIVGQSAMVAP